VPSPCTSSSIETATLVLEIPLNPPIPVTALLVEFDRRRDPKDTSRCLRVDVARKLQYSCARVGTTLRALRHGHAPDATPHLRIVIGWASELMGSIGRRTAMWPRVMT